MAKGNQVPFEIRDEVETALKTWYQHEPKITSLSVEFSTDYFPHKGMARIRFGTGYHSFECLFEYKYGSTGHKELSVTKDWRD